MFRKNFDPLYKKGNIMKRSLVSALVLFFAAAGCLGCSSVPAAGEAETITPEVVKTIEVVKEVEVHVPAPYVPEVCVDALERALEIYLDVYYSMEADLKAYEVNEDMYYALEDADYDAFTCLELFKDN